MMGKISFHPHILLRELEWAHQVTSALKCKRAVHMDTVESQVQYILQTLVSRAGD